LDSCTGQLTQTIISFAPTSWSGKTAKETQKKAERGLS